MKYYIIVLFILLTSQAMAQDDRGSTSITVSPSFAWFTESTPHGHIDVSNLGTRPVEIIADPVFGVIGTSTDGRSSGVLMGGEHAPMRDLTDHLTIFPPRMIIPPGKTQTVRYMVPEASLLPDGGYTTMVSFRASQRAPVIPGQVGATAAGVQIMYTLTVPLVMIRGEGQSALSVASITPTDDGQEVAVLLVNDGNFPWAGTVVLSDDETGEIFGEASTSVYSQRIVPVKTESPISDTIRVMFKRNLSYSGAAHSRVAPPEDVVLIR